MVLAANKANHVFMKKAILSLTFIISCTVSVTAQTKPGFDPDYTWNTIRAEYGAMTPLGTVSSMHSGLFSLSYTRYYAGHWGWRTGAQYARLTIPVEYYAGLPIAVVYRTSTAPFEGRVRKAWEESMEDIERDGAVTEYGYITGYERERMRGDVFANILTIFLRRTEFFAGVTPAYLWGKERTRKGISGRASQDGRAFFTEAGLQFNNSFYLSADAGLSFSIPIWRFSLDITPALHYLFTDNFRESRQDFDPVKNSPVGQPSIKRIRFIGTISGGLSFLF